MTETNYFVTTVIGHDILGRLAGDFRAVLPEVVVVAQVDLLETSEPSDLRLWWSHRWTTQNSSPSNFHS
jgi:hypothetical protein